jgi:hypothetical protein
MRLISHWFHRSSAAMSIIASSSERRGSIHRRFLIELPERDTELNVLETATATDATNTPTVIRGKNAVKKDIKKTRAWIQSWSSEKSHNQEAEKCVGIEMDGNC